LWELLSIGERVRRGIAILSLTFAWLCANGAIWDLAQVLAWGRMFAGYSSTLSVGDALRATLDPAKACELCVGVAKAKEQSATSTPAANSEAAKLVLAMETETLVVSAPAPSAWLVRAEVTPPDWREAVPVPPPRD
jgi:hypothetical protein